MAIDAAELRNVLGQFTTGVTVITTVHEGAPQGMTANSFTAVSLEPPLVLFCSDKRARSGMVVGPAGVFAVNVLAEDQRHLSDLFAGKGTDEERQAVLEAIGVCAETGCPILPESLGWLDCRVQSVIDAGDHIIYLGEVLAASAGEGGAPLLYYRGSYQALEEAWRWRDRRAARDKTTRFHEMVDFFERMSIEAPYAALLDDLLALAEPLDPLGRCLDLGCGAGRVTRDLAPRCREVVGVDSSPAMLERARERAAEFGLANVTYVEAQASALPFPEGSFDRVFIANLLFHLADPGVALREAKRVLRPGGRLVILDPSTTMSRGAALDVVKAQGLRRFAAHALLAWSDAAELGRRYDEERLAADLSEAGLSVLTQARGLSGLSLLALAERPLLSR
jgi:flavin reductase (DIM6/NTAB) family NADH-FMN oxidoreductase RutF/ubiquinone/menaquinone biosynthesis C-methylase UbiE